MDRADVLAMDAAIEEMYGPVKPYRPHKRGFVYFARASDGPVKIGWAQDPVKRVANLQVAQAYPLVLLAAARGGVALERAIHGELSPYRLNGEWFEATPEVLAVIARYSDEEHAH